MTPAPEQAAPIPADVRLWWFLFVLNACGDHGSYANDDPGEWVAAFCDDVEPTDTFNRACDLKLATCTHNSMDETSRVWITEAGKRFLADRASQEERIREDEREACARIADDAARDAGASADRSDARTASGTSVLAGYIFARTEAEAIAKAIRLRARLRGDAS